MKLNILKTVFLLSLLLTACKEQTPSTVPVSAAPPSTLPQSRIVIFFVDISGSFHKFQKEGNFKEQDYFYIACDQIKQYVEQQAGQSHELIIVKTIESSSFSDETVAAKIDFTNSTSEFQEPEPKGAYEKYEKEAWKRRKDSFLDKVKSDNTALIQAFSEKIDALKKREPSNKTDVVNAFKALLQDLKSLPNYPKRIIVYSDFKDNQNKLDSAGVLDFGDDTEIEGRFVSLNDMTPEKYESLIAAWKRILKCKSIEFKTPIKSIK